MSNALREFSTRATPQSEPLPGQVPNSAGGHAWAIDDWGRLDRFLVLGSEGGTYYIGQRKLTRENAECVLRCLEVDGARTVERIAEVSVAGRAPKNDQAIFALALAASFGDERTRRLALDQLPRVCRIGTHLFMFAAFCEQHRGWGRALRRAVGEWYGRDVGTVAHQAVKYRQRDGWTHRDLLRLSHPEPPSPEHAALYAWMVGKGEGVGSLLPPIVHAFERAQAAATPADVLAVIAAHPNIPREAIPSEHLTVEVWDALLRAGMPMTALLRNLATMSRLGLLVPGAEATRLAVEQLCDGEALRAARVHPLAVLTALMTYRSGASVRGSATWTPAPAVIDALDAAFYGAFQNVEPTGKSTMLALDVSASMTWSDIAGLPGVTPRVGSAAMAMVTAAVEQQHVVAAFDTQFSFVPISPRQRLDDVCREIGSLPARGTDCALPMTMALERKIAVETFVVYTDNETWAGSSHPAQALRTYREKTGIPAKLAVVGMTSNGFSIADPSDPGMLDVVGFDAAAPAVMADWAR